MRLQNEKGIATVGALLLAAGIVLLVRLTRRAQRRKAVREDAYIKLRESGEFFSPEGQAARITRVVEA